MSLLAIDPGKTYFGWAYFPDNQLTHCGRETDWWEREMKMRAMLVVIERPQIYNQRQWKGDPNDLIDVALTVGGLMRELGKHVTEIKLVLPHEWKGTVPKKIMQDRILDRLDAVERALVVPVKGVSDVIDAVGLGLWQLGRLRSTTAC